MRTSSWGRIGLIVLAATACARVQPIKRTQVDVLSSRKETSLPERAGLALELTELGNKDGVVAGRAHQVYNCQTTFHEDIRRTDYTGKRLENGWIQVGLAGALLAPGVYLITQAPAYSDTTPEGKSSSSRDNAQAWGAAFSIASAALLGHVGYLWLTSGEQQSSVHEKRKRPQPAVECQRRPAAGIAVSLIGDGELASSETDTSGNFRLDLDDLAANLPLTQGAPELTLAVAEQARAFRPEEWWSAQLPRRRQELLKRMADHQRACDDGNVAACVPLAATYLEGEAHLGVEKDVDRAKALFDKACRGGSADGCFEVGLIYLNVMPTNEREAAKVFGRACEQKHSGGCNNLGVMHERGMGGLDPSLEVARRFYDRACINKNTQACDNLAGARSRLAQRAQQSAEAAEDDAFRRSLKVGSDSHCGLVVAVNGPIAKVQAMVGEVWLKVDQLYPPGRRSCRFVNNVYIDP